ncbi:MAG: PDDEXK nuclease domain-containing protein [bacterium]
MPRNQIATRLRDFSGLVTAIVQIHRQLASQTAKAVNVGLTLRNWFVGRYIQEYERMGEDRARYGAHLLEKLAMRLDRELDRCYTERYLRLCRQLYEDYPQIGKSLISGSGAMTIRKSLISVLPASAACPVSVRQTHSGFSAELMLEALSFTHFVELIKIDDPLKRAFYETECIRGNWSVRELKRQIASLYYERLGLSKNKKKLAHMVRRKAVPVEPAHAVRDPYVFEFLGIKAKEVMGESVLEDSLMDKLQEFLLELGQGFCFEARQKRVLIGGEHFFVDLVFYHRILKCHVLIELKMDDFKHEYLGQLNTYVSWFRAHETAAGDNPPVGILLCTQKNHALVEYALAGMDNRLFVSKYQVELPKKDDIRRFLEEQAEAGSAMERKKGFHCCAHIKK